MSWPGAYVMPTIIAHACAKAAYQLPVLVANWSSAAAVSVLTGQPIGLLVVDEYGGSPVTDKPKNGQLPTGEKAISASESRSRMGCCCEATSSRSHKSEATEIL